MKNTSRLTKKASHRILSLILIVLTSVWIATQVAGNFNFPLLVNKNDNHSLDTIDIALSEFKTSKEEFLNQLENAIQNQNAKNSLTSVQLDYKLVALNRTIDKFSKQSLSKLDDKQQSEIDQLLGAIKSNNKEILDKIIKPLQEGLGCNSAGYNCQNVRKIQQYFFPRSSRDIDGILGERTISKVDDFLSIKINNSERKLKELKLVKQKNDLLNSARDSQLEYAPNSSLKILIILIFFLLIALLIYIYILSVKLKSIKYELDKKIRNSLQENDSKYKAYLQDSLKKETESDKKLHELEDKLKLLEQSLKAKQNSATPEAIKIDGALELSPIIKIDLPKNKLVEIYNDCPQVLSSNIIIVSVTADSYRQKTQGQIFLERVGRGNYWVVATKDGQYWLFPNSNISINIHKLKTIQFMFDCIGDYSSSDANFSLNQPARVAILPSGKKWKVEKKGILVFNNDSPSSQSRSDHSCTPNI